MLSFLVLSVIACAAASSSSSSSNNDDESGFVLGDDGFVEEQEGNNVLNFLLESSSASGDSSSDSDSAASFSNTRRAKLLDRNIEEKIKLKLAIAIEKEDPAVKRESFQARFTRTPLTLPLGAGVDPNDFNRTIGPLLVIAKLTPTDVTADSFDGNNDGQLDVLSAYNAWSANSNGTQTTEIQNFLQQVRNRASVNGGSIVLKALVLSGSSVATKKTKSSFLKFSQTQILISPCFPITNEVDADHPTWKYHIVVYGGGVGNGTLVRSQNIYFDDVFDGTEFTTGQAGPYTLTREQGFRKGAVEGQFVLQRCTQFSYFQ